VTRVGAKIDTEMPAAIQGYWSRVVQLHLIRWISPFSLSWLTRQSTRVHRVGRVAPGYCWLASPLRLRWHLVESASLLSRTPLPCRGRRLARQSP